MSTGKRFSEAQLVSFAKYVLSLRRSSLIKTKVKSGVTIAAALREVYDADLENWKAEHTISQIKQA